MGGIKNQLFKLTKHGFIGDGHCFHAEVKGQDRGTEKKWQMSREECGSGMATTLGVGHCPDSGVPGVALMRSLSVGALPVQVSCT
jgi:hypothetical protein